MATRIFDATGKFVGLQSFDPVAEAFDPNIARATPRGIVGGSSGGGGSSRGSNRARAEAQAEIGRQLELKRRAAERAAAEARRRIELQRIAEIERTKQLIASKIKRAKTNRQRSNINKQRTSLIRQINSKFLRNKKKLFSEIKRLNQSPLARSSRQALQILGGSKKKISQLDSRQAKLNKEIETFNKSIEKKTLTDAGFKQANKKFQSFESRQKAIDKERESLPEKALKKKIGKQTKGQKVLEFVKPSAETKLLTAIAFGSRIVDNISGLKAIPGLGAEIVATRGKAIKPITQELAKGIWSDWKETWVLAKVSPRLALAKVGADIFTFRTAGKGLKLTGKLSGKAARRVNPKFKSFKSGTIKLKVPKETFVRRGKDIFLRKRVGKFRTPIDIIKGRKRGQFKKFQKTKGIELKKGLLTDNAKSLSEQTKLAGKKGTIVTAQADRLVNFLRRKKIIRKPIPGEVSFTKTTKNLLEKFDEGTISKRDFYKLNKRVLDESGKTLLERSLFADPNGLIRFTRLGQQAGEASIRDILRGNFSFKKSKPQVIVFPEGKIAKFPKSLKKVVDKLKSNKRLTATERTKLVRFQTKKGSGKWKPIGDTEYRGGIELEVTLAPGETIRRVKKLAVTEIDGVGVNIVQAEVIKLKPQIGKLLNKAKKGTISKVEISKLKSGLKKQLRLPVSTKDIKNLNKFIKKPIRRRVGGKPRVPINRIVIEKGGRIARSRKRVSTRKITPRKVTPRRVSRRKPTSRRKPSGRRPIGRVSTRRPSPRKPTPRKPVPRKPTPRKPTPRKPVPRKPTPRKPVPRKPVPRLSPPRVPKPKPKIIGFKRKIKKKKKKKVQAVFNVFGRSKGKFVKLNSKPLTRGDALSKGSFAVDRTTARTFKIVPAGKTKKPGRLLKSERNYFNRQGFKLREVKIRKGRKFQLKNKYIEKRRFGIDTRSEKKGLTIAKLLKQRGIKPKTKVKRKITPARRKLLLKNLAKARRARRRKR